MGIRDGKPVRDGNGRFVPGHDCVSPGRPRKEHAAYLDTLWSACSKERWTEICEKAVTQAMKGDSAARQWVSKYILVEPKTVHEIRSGAPPSRLELLIESGLSVDDITAMAEEEE